MKFSQQRTRVGGAIACFLLLVTFACVFYLNFQQGFAARAWVQHTGTVLDAIHVLEIDLRELELQIVQNHNTDPTVLARLSLDVERDIKTIGNLTRDNSSQQQNIEECLRLYSQLIRTANANPKTALPTLADWYDKDLKLRKVLDSMREEENRNLRERLAKVDQAFFRDMALAVALFLVFGPLLFMTFGLLLRKIQVQQHERNSSRKLIAELEERSTEASLQNSFSQSLQLCTNLEDAYEVIGGFIESLFPGVPGAVAFVNNSRNLVSVTRKWGGESSLTGTFVPESCCAFRLSHAYSYPQESFTLTCRHFVAQNPDVYFCMPLVAQGETIGLVYLQTNASLHLRIGTLPLLADQAAMAIANLRLRDQLRNQSLKDPLTGLFNRRYLDSVLTREVDRALRQKKCLGALMVDVDHFKSINDRFGHEVGDQVIKRIGEALQNFFRDSDVVCRFGGEEFAVLLTDTNMEGAVARADSFRAEVAQMTWLILPGHRVTISMGLALCPDHGQSPDQLMRAADKALYEAKGSGRNRLILTSTEEIPEIALAGGILGSSHKQDTRPGGPSIIHKSESI